MAKREIEVHIIDMVEMYIIKTGERRYCGVFYFPIFVFLISAKSTRKKVLLLKSIYLFFYLLAKQTFSNEGM